MANHQTCRWKYVAVIIRNKSCVGNFVQELKLVKRKDIAEKVKWNNQLIKHCTNLWMLHSCVSGTWKCRYEQGLWEGVSAGIKCTQVRGQESQEGTSESLQVKPCCIIWLCLSLLILYIKYMLSAHWTFCCTGNETFIKVYHWFYWTSNPKFWKKSQPIPGAAKQSWSTLHHFSWRPSMWEFLLTSLNDGQTTIISMSHSIYKNVQSHFFSYWNNWCGLKRGHVFHKIKDLLKGS
jgi:hypothetical protein